MERETYKIKIGSFQGPFGVLLDLVEKRKLFINDVSLALVTEDYLKYLNGLGGVHPGEVSSFVLVASTLLLIKSKSLLPNLDLTAEETGDIESLKERLRLYELIMRESQVIKSNFGKKIIFASLERKTEIVVFLPDEQITREAMMAFAMEAVNTIPQKVFLPKVEVKKVISLEEMIDKLKERISTAVRMNFKDFHGKPTNKEEKVNVIIGFLAMLELVREGIIEAIQENSAGEIIIGKMESVLNEQ